MNRAISFDLKLNHPRPEWFHSLTAHLNYQQDVLILGAHGSGKSKLMQFVKNQLAERKPDQPMLVINALNPVSSWIDCQFLQEYANSCNLTWKKMLIYQKIDLLCNWPGLGNLILCIDDAHRLSPGKLLVLMRLIEKSRQVVLTSFTEQTLSPQLRLLVQQRGYQDLQLSTEVPYDATSFLVWLCMLGFFALGYWELGVVIAGIKLSGRGPFKLRQR
jgi:hypothetical protein